MYAEVLLILAPLSLFYYFILCPIFIYFRDRKKLRRYPAMNAVAGITDLGFMYEAARGFRTKRLTELHKTHPIVRIGPNSLSFTGTDSIKSIYGHGTSCSKDVFYEVTGGSHTHLADVIDKSEHTRKRKTMSAAYAIKNLEEWEHKVADKTMLFMKACDAACTKALEPGETSPRPMDLTFDYREWTNYFTIDAIADIGLSEKLGFLDNGSDRITAERLDGTLYDVNFRETLHSTALSQVCLVWAYPWFKFNEKLAWLLSGKMRRLLRLGSSWNDIIYHRARKRLARYERGEELRDFFQVLMEDKAGNPNNLEFGEIFAEISIMMNAGSDTTAISMANAMFNLLSNPSTFETLRKELDSALDEEAGGDSVEEDDGQDKSLVAPYDKVKHLPYLRAVLDESLRLFPPVTFNLPRRTPPSGCAIGSEYIPGDTTVSISAWTAHRDETVFVEPEKFVPERWLSEKSSELQRAFVPFSTGARGCIGRNISYLEQSVLLSSIVYQYDLALPSPNWEPERVEGTNLLIKDMPLKIWRRRRQQQPKANA